MEVEPEWQHSYCSWQHINALKLPVLPFKIRAQLDFIQRICYKATEQHSCCHLLSWLSFRFVFRLVKKVSSSPLSKWEGKLSHIVTHTLFLGFFFRHLRQHSLKILCSRMILILLPFLAKGTTSRYLFSAAQVLKISASRTLLQQHLFCCSKTSQPVKTL